MNTFNDLSRKTDLNNSQDKSVSPQLLDQSNKNQQMGMMNFKKYQFQNMRLND